MEMETNTFNANEFIVALLMDLTRKPMEVGNFIINLFRGGEYRHICQKHAKFNGDIFMISISKTYFEPLECKKGLKIFGK